MRKILNKRDLILIGITLFSGLFLGWIFFHNSGSSKAVSHEHAEEAEAGIWTCSMHPQIKQDKPGLCPICAMDLVLLESESSDDENISPDEIQMSEASIKLAEIQTTIVQAGIPENKVYLLGKVKADERNIAQLTARIGGRIEKLFINYTGQQVKKGQKLATIYSPDLVNAQKELIEAYQYKESNPGFYKAIKSKLKLWDLTDKQIASIEDASEPILYFEILSPISGTVTLRHVAMGDYVKEGSALFEVTDLSKVWIMFDAYESDLAWIQLGDKIDFNLQSLPGNEYASEVTYIDPFIDAQSRTAQVRLEIANPKLIFKPEMFANGILESKLANNSNEILIPKTAMLWTGKRAVVYVKVPNRKSNFFIYREITLGAEAGNFYVVKKGLFAGEEIAVNGVFKIDAAAQLAGKPSMMNPAGGASSTGHDHGQMTKDEGKESPNVQDEPKANLEHEMFKVSGNCEMCKKTIEKAALALKGVNSAVWDVKKKVIHVSFNKDKVDLIEIHKAIAASGYDTELETAPIASYEKLAPCCKYTKD
ncbi:MAG: efflux RND transporter periplasmic adaptor subunit [Bacteroidetes bacterium]|jgi:membrane fusion protein, copper/silver efflux system|nr:efflux RND transporter periplasmic adaptor subunit [Bacteroidota bacterium]MBT3802614.1 efflux RND transporter periplasmic adaptor subunit [Bacteroidota bacterium]MBT4728320.1 efflux RND transporter periplasmic adaptor subunit [Bacteroidota bacterium]MBT5991115.1 efflux RND transporter periplasmic adaptor subunit [Bacteroidota bacterium]MBT7825884.1 efflux RND transporter periplasmic adaptor subunit [Bacteroidota bacterium]